MFFNYFLYLIIRLFT